MHNYPELELALLDFLGEAGWMTIDQEGHSVVDSRFHIDDLINVIVTSIDSE